MSLSALSTTLFATGTLITLIAGALWVRAWRGKPSGWASCCRRCGFRLQGLNPDSTACPECGLDLHGASALRPIARQRDAARWGHAVIATSAGLLLLWLGQGPPLVRAGRWLCVNMPNGLLVRALPWMPLVATGEVDARIRSGAFTAEQRTALAQTAARIATDQPADRGGPGARVLATLAEVRSLDDATLCETLRTTLAGVTPVAGTPRACKPEGAFIVTATLPATQPAIWVTRNELRLTITSASVREADGTLRPLAPISAEARGSTREFDGTAFRAPSAPGTFEGELRVRMQRPGGGFEAEATAPFQLRVVDPSMVQVTFAPNARTASLLREWLGKGSCAVDAPGTGLLVSLPGDSTSLQAEPVTIAGALQVVQGDLKLDVGRVWIDDTLPTISLFAAPMPAALDRTKPATLRFVPDQAFAMGVASSSCTALGDVVEVPIALPPPPAAAVPPANAAASPSPAP